MPTTSNFGWTTPADTDLVKDGAAAIRTLGNGIDTSLIDLKGGTTGQILSKASNADLDYTWIANDQGDITNVGVTSPITGGGSSGSVTIGIDDGTTAQKGAVQLEDSTSSTSTTKAATPNSVKSAYDLANGAIAKSLIDAEGDLIVGDAADAVQRLAIGSNGNVLTVDTAVDGKIKWAAPASGSTFVGASVHNNGTDYSISNTTYTVLDFSTEDYDTDGFHSTTTNTSRFTIPSGKDGKYLVTFWCGWNNASAGLREVAIRVNGSAVTNAGTPSSSANGTSNVFSAVVNLVATDYVDARVWQNSGGTLGISGTSLNTRFQISYLGA